MAIPNEGIQYDRHKRCHVIVIVLDPDETENIAHALGLTDAGARQLLEWATRARQLDEG